MARAPTTLDAFAAVAEPKRRLILETLGSRQMPVTQIVDALRWPQPMVSKHLAILRKVGLLHVQRRSRQKVYEVNGEQLKTIYEWVGQFEKLWDAHLLRVKARAEAKQQNQSKEKHS